jgi:hypothetical protein
VPKIQEFQEAVRKWKTDCILYSSCTKMFENPHYRKIIAMGKDVVPLLLTEFKERPDHWDCALREITEEDPVPDSSAGKLKEIADAWINWGRIKGLINDKTPKEA